MAARPRSSAVTHIPNQVEIQVELEELEEHASEEQPDLFDFDPFDTVVGQEGESDSGSDDGSDGEDNDDFSDLSSDAEGDDDSEKVPEEEPTNMQHVQDMVNKLDAILKNIFDYFKHSHTISERPSPPLPTPSSPKLSESRSSTPLTTHPIALPENSEAAMALRRTQFYTLLSIFDRTILRTFKSRYTQFIVFWFSSLDPEFSDLFQGMLVSKALLEEDQPAVTRAAAASYIASFVSRAVFVDKDSTRQVVACLCNFLNNRLDILDAVTQSGANLPSLAHHSVFYAVTQAVFLIFCFRWRDLMHEEEEVDELAGAGEQGKWMNELAVLKRAVQSQLNPLKVRLSLAHSIFVLIVSGGLREQCCDAIRARRARHGLSLLLLHHRSQPTIRVLFNLSPTRERETNHQPRRRRRRGARRAQHVLPFRSVQTSALGSVYRECVPGVGECCY